MRCRIFHSPETIIDKQQLYSYPRVGAAVIVTHQQRVLFGKRVVASEEFVWQLPGGWIELGEFPEQAASREVAEETGLELNELRFVGLTNNKFSDQDQSISIYFEGECSNPEQKDNRESARCEQWVWMQWQELQNNLYLPLQLLKDTDYQPFLGDQCGVHVSF